MLSIGQWPLQPDQDTGTYDASAPPRATATHNFERDIATFSFGESKNGSPDRALPPTAQDLFKADFSRELARVRAWATAEDWACFAVPDLRVFVADDYRISKSLVPAWYGHRGHMEFPARRVAAGKAAIAHELVHVLLPNGNRFLAEGLAVYLQAKIGGNPAFPNFGQPLHELARSRLREMVREFRHGDPTSLDRINLADLDEIATPGPLALKVGQDLYGEDRRGQAALYPLAGSFVEFLIEARGMEKFRTLYWRTPFVPHERSRGSSGRWMDVYGRSLADLELEWKTLMVRVGPGRACSDESGGLDRGHGRIES
jgi:hypothetical protein